MPMIPRLVAVARLAAATGLAVLALAGPAALPAVAERVLERLEDFDLPGGDYETLRRVPLETCEEACLGDQACAAFTYNSRVRWCFLKTSAGEREPYAGAISAIVRENAEPGESLPLPDIAYLPSSIVTEGAALEAKLSAARRTRADIGVVTQAFAAVAQPGTAAAYLSLATALLAQNYEDWTDKREAERLAGAAGYLALKAADTPDEQGRALAQISRAMERQGLYRPAIEASAASVTLAFSETEQTRLTRLRAEHGFRVLDYTVDADTLEPRLCVQFSEPLAGEAGELERFVAVDRIASPTLSVDERQLCVEGLEHGERYVVTVREGVPSTVGETLTKEAEFRAYVRDRTALARFESNRYVLPASSEGVPVTTVNTAALEMKLYRVNDRNLADVVRNGDFKRQLWSYEVDQLAEDRGALVWEGELEVEETRNEDVTTLFPVASVLRRTEPGVYVLTATPAELADRANQTATQWFVVSDLGLTSYSSGGTVDVFLRSLLSAEPKAGVEVTLLAANDELLATAVTDADGHARLVSSAPTEGGQRPAVVTAQEGADYAFLPLVGGAFELTDRGVEGRAAPGPVDAFLATERGVYRGGETVHLTALVRDDAAHALPLPVTVRLVRPDGVTSRQITERADAAGGMALDMDLTANAATGTWTVSAHIDPDGPAVGSTTFLVEDYVPQRISVDLSTEAERAVPGETFAATVAADFLYGAPAGGLMMEGSVTVRPADGIDGFEGYVFGLAQEPFSPARAPLFDLPRTGEDGRATLDIAVPELEAPTGALEARVLVSVREPGGRRVADAVTLPVASEGPLIGIKPRFEGGRVAQGTRAAFDVIALSAAHERVPATAEWTLTRITRNFQWYRRNGRWAYESVDRLEEVANGQIVIETADPASVSAPVEWGRYRLEVTDAADDRIASSIEFSAGWVSANASADTPDILEVHLDRESYGAGDTATLTIVPRYAGRALVTVLSGQVREHHLVDVPLTGAEVELTVAEDWSPGAYVAATLYRPVEVAADGLPLPQRAVGIAHMDVGTVERRLEVAIDAPDTTRPRELLTVPVRVSGLEPGASAHLTLAAVDVGILNITGYTPPDVDEHYLGQRRLAVELRDLYGELIDSAGAARGRIRSGGDGPGSGGEALPLAEEPVSLFTGVLETGPDGVAEAQLDIPSFNGTLKLMAIVWSAEKVGDASRDMVVRDPVVVSGTLPRFLAPNDASRMRIDLHNVAHQAGEYTLRLAAVGPVALDAEERTVTLAEGERASFEVALAATGAGEAGILASLTGPGGLAIGKEYTIVSRPAAAEVSERRIQVLEPGGALTLGRDRLAGYGEDAEVTMTLATTSLDVAGLLRILDRFPYGCAEQTVSRAMPLLVANDVAVSAGLAADQALPERIRSSIDRVLAYQSASGGFGLWSPGGDLWLTAYVMDFLTRAREAGYDVPTVAYEQGLDRLQSVLSYIGEFDAERGSEIAYATYVLARNGRAAIGDVRYFAEERIDDFTPPLARAQLAASLAFSGDPVLAERVFAEEVPQTLGNARDNRRDFGTPLRDAAAVVALASEARVSRPVMANLQGSLERIRAGVTRTYSTQEAAWLVVGANALADQGLAVVVDGAALTAPVSRTLSADDLAAGLAFENPSDVPLLLATTVTGTPVAPLPPVAAGLTVERTFHALDGTEVSPDRVDQNTRLLVKVTVTKTVDDPMRLMLTDLLPAGFEIENPRLVDSDAAPAVPLAAQGQRPEHTEFRDDRFAAAWNLSQGGANRPMSVAYMVRAISPGTFTLPPAEAVDMYQPSHVARTAAGTVTVVPTR